MSIQILVGWKRLAEFLFPFKLEIQQLKVFRNGRVDMVISKLISKVGNVEYSSLPAQSKVAFRRNIHISQGLFYQW